MSLDLILESIRSKRCLPFLGAGASASYSHDGSEVAGVALGGSLAEIISQACEYPNGSSHDLASVAEYYVYQKNGRRNDLEELLCQHINGVITPRPIHTVLSQLEQVRFVITSNYDQLLEVEFHRYGRNLIKHFYDSQNPKTGHCDAPFHFRSHDVVLHKMHGTVEQPRSMVITQSDYIRYLSRLTDCDRGMPEYFRKFVIPQHTLLFLGYNLDDWNFRVIWEGVLASHHDSGNQIESYAIVRQSTEFQRNFWAKRNITLINFDLTELAKVLAHKFNLEIPQLRIAKTKGGADQ